MGEPAPGRPRFPREYGIPDTAQGMLPWAWVSERLARTRNYWVASVTADGAPHAMPVWALWFGDSLVFSTSPTSRKGRNLARDPRVSIHVERDDDVVVLTGEVEQIALDEAIADAYAAKYAYRPWPGTASEGWYRLRPRVAYAWDRDYPRTATRFSFD